MNRPRNRQPRGNHRQTSARNTTRAPSTPQQAAGLVPKSHQVVPGASVAIVLKEDQPTGRETVGIVTEVLTSGDHPRGIKVKLRSGQVGRVQRMTSLAVDASWSPSDSNHSSRISQSSSTRFSHRYTDIRNDDAYPSEPPPRSLADFLPATFGNTEERFSEPAVKCPFCEKFEGDETAVTYHIEELHLS